MDSFYSFVCQQVAKQPVLIGETARSIQLGSPYSSLDASSKKILAGDIPASGSSDEAMSSVVMRSLIAPLNPSGIGHLVYTVIWPFFLAAESAAKKLEKAKREEAKSRIKSEEASTSGSSSSSHGESSANTVESALHEYLECRRSLDTAFEEARKKIGVVECYVEVSGGLDRTFSLLSRQELKRIQILLPYWP